MTRKWPSAYYGRASALSETKASWIGPSPTAPRLSASNPRHANAYAIRGWAYGEKGEWDKAIADCTEAVRLDPKNAAAYGARGCAYANKGEWDKAIADCTEAIRLDPTCSGAYAARACACACKGQWDDAVADITEAIRQDPKNADWHYRRGIVYQRRDEARDLDKDIADAKVAIGFDAKKRGLCQPGPGFPRRAGLGQGHCRLVGHHPAGTEKCQCLPQTRLAPRGEARLGQGHRRFHRGHPPESARRLLPTTPCGLAYEGKGELDKAIADYTEAIRLNPACLTPYYLRGKAFQQEQDHKAKAEADFAQAKRLGYKAQPAGPSPSAQAARPQTQTTVK